MIGTPFRRNKGDAVSETVTPQHGPRERVSPHRCDQDIELVYCIQVTIRKPPSGRAAETKPGAQQLEAGARY